ncbi:putative sulfate exporter family transporter [Marinifilum sp. N1E240]|uniref:YeiH family protein n=1 Tax=Marinifilum sp. N1E240 TaxID=2608082 RepID=UPI00128AEEB6|nr:putative sulfate exporter family transporter [Marinifilum sp. N1E240]MPQ47734.1 putative sulfate exporter family transporter [Marinifilum sp. N1E240]
MTLNQKQIKTIYGAILFLCFMPFISPSLALGLGIVLSLMGLKHDNIAKYTSFSLQASIVLMGFGMNLTQVISASKTGFIDTAISVVFVMCVGLLITRLLKIESKIGLLISAGTAICGGSAIAAVAPVLHAKNYQVSFSLVVIFILNAIALLIFPILGHYFNMSQETFGTWAAIAIHDTSSVVGAGATYGVKALEVATTVKLIRALWIIPLSLVIAFTQKDKANGKIKIPWFIGLFVASILTAYLFPSNAVSYEHLNWLGKRGMVIALFLIGSNISFSEAKQAGFKSFVLGVLLWFLIAIGSFLALTSNF